MNQTIRIIGGRFRGKKLHFPANATVRPTLNRIRETLFNWLMHDIHGTHCLDAFAGSGALGLEAFSRGATQVVLIEQCKVTYHHLRNTVNEFHTPQIQLYAMDTRHYLQQTPDVFDIIFLDPPFDKGDCSILNACIAMIGERPVLKPQGLLYIESAQPIHLDHTLWTTLKLKHTGQVHYALYQKV